MMSTKPGAAVRQWLRAACGIASHEADVRPHLGGDVWRFVMNTVFCYDRGKHRLRLMAATVRKGPPMAKTNAGSQSARKDDGNDMIYRLRVDLAGVRPPVWRVFTIPGAVSLYQLHRAFQAVMGWGGGHLYVLEIGGVSYGDPDPEFSVRNAKSSRLKDAADPGGHFTYLYDFGDDWLHTVHVEEVRPRQANETVPQLLAGQGACPPEDIGGPPGYAQFLEAMTDPLHPEHEEMAEWIGGQWDSDAFDQSAYGKRLFAAARIAHWERTGS